VTSRYFRYFTVNALWRTRWFSRPRRLSLRLGMDITIPDGYTLHTENDAHILLASNEAFLNPIQEFNRDLSVACIRVWSEQLNKCKELKRNQIRERKEAKKRKRESL
jgi:hypothetical protein